MSQPGLAWLTDRLPPIERIRRRSEADYYGASYVIACSLGYRAPPRSIASWKHGVIYEPKLEAPELLLTEGNRATRHLVATAHQVTMLRAAGFPRVHAVGVPFIYTEPAQVSRVPGSLLIMPAHTLSKSTHTFDEASYASAIASIMPRFESVAASVNAACVTNGTWVRTFDQIGIPWFIGADSRDRNALRRMSTVFRTFEYMTTNTLGSHVAYAAYCGCKVSIWGPFAEPRLEDYKNIAWYQKNWKYVPELIRIYSETHVRANHPILFQEPWEARELRSWAEPYLGVENKRSKEEMARLLGWTSPDRPEALIHGAVSRCRRATKLVRRALRRFGESAPG